MPKTIISDTSCLIVLTNIGQIDLLRITYGTVTTTFEVASEFGEPLPDWIELSSPVETSRQKLLERQLDRGEASAIALALETPGSTIILDDQKARRVAEKLGLEITGTLGVIVRAKLNGTIPSIRPLVTKIQETEFRLTQEVVNQAFQEAGE